MIQILKNVGIYHLVYTETLWDEFCERFGTTKHRQWLIN